MPKRSSKRKDVNETAFAVVQQATGEAMSEVVPGSPEDPLRAAARVLGRLGGLKGGKARAEKLSKKRRQQIARTAARARWSRDEGKSEGRDADSAGERSSE